MDTRPKETPSERRHDARERTFLQARLIFGHGALSTPCTVTQLSATGARLTLPEGVTLPDHFELAIPQRGIHCQARIIWRRDAQAGVAFAAEGEASLAPDSQDYAGRIKELEIVNGKLKAQVADLLAQVRRLTED